MKYSQRCKFDADKDGQLTRISPKMLGVIISTSYVVVCILAFVWIRKVRICRGTNEPVEPVGDVNVVSGHVVGCELQERE